MAAGRGRSRRVSLPGIAELLRPAAIGPDGGDQRLASGRQKHTQKITVYLSAEELLDLERARLALLRYGAAADRGRIVREAIAVLLADLDAQGQESLLARRIATNRAGDYPLSAAGDRLGHDHRAHANGAHDDRTQASDDRRPGTGSAHGGADGTGR